MPLTVRTDGTGSTNLITAQWFNDYHDLLTGAMADQPVTVNNDLTLKGVTFTTPTAPTLALAAGSAMGVGSYTYAVSFQMGNGQTLPGATASITTTTGNQEVTLTAIPLGPTGTTARIVYRSKVGTSTPLYSCFSINDNTTGSHTDTHADSSLVVQAPSHGSFGGSLIILDQSGNTKAQLFNDGAVSFDGSNITSDGSGNLVVHSISIGGGSLTVTGTSSLDNGNILTDGSGNLVLKGGKLGYSTAGDILDYSSTDVFIKGKSAVIWFQPFNGTNALGIEGGGGTGIIFNGYLGFKTTGGTKVAELKSNGSMSISGTTYFTTAGSAFVSTGGSFDGFDFSEVYQVDHEYPTGTVVCPKDVTTPVSYDGTPQLGLPILSECTHDACNLAGVVVAVPGFCSGVPNVPSMGEDYDSTQPMKQAVAHAGRAFALAGVAGITGRTYLCSNGAGGVRPMQAGEHGMALGIALSPDSSGMVPLLIRPVYI